MNTRSILTLTAAGLLGGVGILGTVGVLGGAGQAAAQPAAAATGAFAIDGVHSHLIFRVKHMNVAYSYGRFNKITGSFNLDAANAGASVIDITVDANSVDTQNAKRDDHLRSPDFFSVKEFPEITFKSTSVKHTTGDTFEVTGDLTAHGVTKAVTATVVKTGEGEGRGGSQLSGLESTFTIKRSDFGMNYMPQALGDEITITLSLEGVKR